MENKEKDNFLICCNGFCPRKKQCYRYQKMISLIKTDNAHDRRYKSVPIGYCTGFEYFRESK